jgi:dienelactone hydrolase
MMRKLFAATLALATIAVFAACSSSNDNADPTEATTASTTDDSGTTTTIAPQSEPQTVVFSGQGNDLAAYLAEPPFTKQVVITHFDEVESPDGLDINAQICFDPQNPRRFVAGEDTHQPDPLQGWGIFELSGDRVGEFSAKQIGKLTPTYQGASDNAENYGCGFLDDGRIVTTDVGNQAAGPPNGQLIVWYPPFDSFDVAYCKVDVGLGTGQQITMTPETIYVAQSRGPEGGGPGIYSYPVAEFPETPDDCDQTDSTGAPYHPIEASVFVAPNDDNEIATPNAMVAAPNGNWYVSSVINGLIAEIGPDGEFVRNVLRAPEGEALGPVPYSTGTPLGMGVGPDGSLYYADIGIVVDDGIGPGRGTGKVRRITFNDDGSVNPPEIMDEGLAFPDGIGIFTVPQSGPEDREPFEGLIRTRLRLVDDSRDTPIAGDRAARPQRVLLTDIYTPPGDGPFPLIVHAHGFGGGPPKFTQLLSQWAGAGYIVAAPRFPLSSDTGPGNAGISDFPDQPGDVSFVIDELLASNDLGPKIDPAHIGVSGLSLGGGTIYGLVWSDCCRDDRITAAIVMSSLRFPFDGEYGVNEIPVMIMHGDADPALPYDDAVTSYEDSASPKWFVHLFDAGHAEPYENTVSPHDDVVTQVTLDFWAGTLGGDAAALDAITTDGTIADLSEVRSE